MNRSFIAILSTWYSLQVTIVSRPVLFHCMLRKKVKQFCSMYLILHSQCTLSILFVEQPLLHWTCEIFRRMWWTLKHAPRLVRIYYFYEIFLSEHFHYFCRCHLLFTVHILISLLSIEFSALLNQYSIQFMWLYFFLTA